MKFQKVPDDVYLINRHEITVNGRQFEVGLGQVMYGFRIRGGFVGDMVYWFDWCCGANQLVIVASQKVLMDLIERGIPLKTIPPHSNIKPWFNDKEFVQCVDNLYGEEVFGLIAKAFDEKIVGA